MRFDLCQGAAALVDEAAPAPARDFRQIRSGAASSRSETIVGAGGARARGLFIYASSL
jgi:hypothetical protein